MTNFIPENPEALMRRAETAAALTAAGYPTATATLATKATRGGGPEFQTYGRIPLYKWRVALAWAESRMSAPRCTTSEGDLRPPNDGGKDGRRTIIATKSDDRLFGSLPLAPCGAPQPDAEG
jgi:hypothetical protein